MISALQKRWKSHLFTYICILLPFGTLSADTKDSVLRTPRLDAEETRPSGRDNDSVPLQKNNEHPPLDKLPELVRFVEAEYPISVYGEGIEGDVLMTLLVNDSGAVDSIWLEHGVHPVLDSNALAAARQFQFEPAVAGGQTVPVYLRYEYRFSLREVAKQIEPVANFGGRLLERGTRNPIPDAMVVISFLERKNNKYGGLPFDLYRQRIGEFEEQYLEEDRLVTMSDSTGRFTFYSLPRCSVEISIPVSGYERIRDTLLIDAAQEVRMEYYLPRMGYSEYEIAVYGKTSEKEISRRRLSLNEIKRVPGLGGDAVKVVQALPGVNRPRMGSGQMIVRGAPTWDTKYFLDGISLPTLYHFFGLKSVYNSEGLEHVSFYPGGFGVRYGGGVAGVIELTGRQAKTDRWHGRADLSTTDASFVVEGPVKEQLSLLGSARRSFIGHMVNLAIDNIDYDFPFSVSPFYWDYLLRADYKVSDNLKLFTTFLGSRDSMLFHDSQNTGEGEGINEQAQRSGMSIMFHLAMLGIDWRISKRLANTFRYGYNYSIANCSVFDKMNTNSISHDHHFRNQLDMMFWDNIIVSTGIDLHFFILDQDVAFPITQNWTKNYNAENRLLGTLGAYSFAEWKPIEDLQIIGGLRYDFFPELNYRGAFLPELWDYESFDNKTPISGEPSARLNCRYALAQNHVLKGAVGNYSQTPQPIGQVTMEGWGNPMLSATKASHYVLGYEWQITDLIRADIQAYNTRQWNIPRLAGPEELEDEGIYNMQNLWKDNGRGRMWGIELMLRHDRGDRFFGWLAYTLSRSERYNHQKKRYELYHEDETHNIQLVGSWRLPRLWEAGFRLRYVTGKPAKPIIDIKESKTYNHFIPVYAEAGDGRMDPFFQIDLRVDKRFVFDKWIISAYLDLQNVSWFFYRSPEFELQDELYKDKTVSNIFMPGIGLNAEF